jgi:hypothetical protein
MQILAITAKADILFKNLNEIIKSSYVNEAADISKPEEEEEVNESLVLLTTESSKTMSSFDFTTSFSSFFTGSTFLSRKARFELPKVTVGSVLLDLGS